MTHKWIAGLCIQFKTLVYKCMLLLCMQVDIPNLQSRFSHSAAAFSLSQGLMETTIFGGCPEWPSGAKFEPDLSCMANTIVLRFSEYTLNALVTTVAKWWKKTTQNSVIKN